MIDGGQTSVHMWLRPHYAIDSELNISKVSPVSCPQIKRDLYGQEREKEKVSVKR